MLLRAWDDGLLWLLCFPFGLVGAHSGSGSLPPPENFSLSWDPNTLSVTARWEKPVGLDSECKVNYTLAIYFEKCHPNRTVLDKGRTDNLNYKFNIPKEDEICVGITTHPMACEEKHASKEEYKHLSPPLALVKNFSCAYYDNNKMNCTWTVVSNTPNLQLFYREVIKNTELKSCTSYLTKGPMKTGCHLHDTDLMHHSKVYFVISGTAENKPIINKFMIEIDKSVKPPKPKVNIKLEGQQLSFQASTPNFLQPQCWRYKYTYIKGSEPREVIEPAESITKVEYDTACRYTVQGQVIYSNNCGGDKDIESDLSDPEYYGQDGDPNLEFKVAMIITPLIVCCFLITAIVMFRRNKHIILPKIPEPSLFFKDMLNTTSDGISKSLGGGKLYVPVKEVVATGVSLEPKSLLLPPNHDTCI